MTNKNLSEKLEQIYWLENIDPITEIICDDIRLHSGIILEANDEFVTVASRIDNEEFETQVYIEAIYKSKQECIDAFKKRLDEL